MIAAVDGVQPEGVYNLAAISYLSLSWQQAERQMLARDEPEDYVGGHRDDPHGDGLVERSFETVGLDWCDHLVCDAAFIRRPRWTSSASTRRRHGEAGWKPKTTLAELVEMTVKAPQPTGPATALPEHSRPVPQCP